MINIDIDAEDCIAGLAKVLRGVENLQPALNKVGLYMERETKLNFAKESTPDGAPWARLAASTVKKGGGGILVRSGALQGGIAAQPASNTEVQVRSNGPFYNVFHQSGTSRMPAREFIGLAARHEPKIKQIFEAYLRSLA